MENASKALIIAGAILLAILIISLGIMIFNQARSAIDGSGMSEIEIQAFNQKFLKYADKQKGSNIRNMVQEVIANNSNDEASSETYVTITGIVTLASPTEGATNPQPNYGSLKNTQTYTVTFIYGTSGRITTINVQ